jgi:hypothetical protein
VQKQENKKLKVKKKFIQIISNFEITFTLFAINIRLK